MTILFWLVIAVTWAGTFISARLIYWQRKLIEAQELHLEAKDDHITALERHLDAVYTHTGLTRPRIED